MDNQNPFQPPKSNLISPEARSCNEALFFPVSLTKLAVMSLATCGWYSIYWFYKNWKMIKDRENSDIWPVGRAFFAIFFWYALFKRVRDYEGQHDYPKLLAAGPLAIVLVLCAILPYLLPIPWNMLGFLSFLFLLVVQSHVNHINMTVAPDHDPNGNFTLKSWLSMIVLGGLGWYGQYLVLTGKL